MLPSLKFVQGVIKRNNITPELEHYRIEAGRVTGFNGHMALSAPLDIDLKAYPHAGLFYKAIEACKDKVALHMTKSQRLAVQSGGFKAYVPCLEDVGYRAQPQGAEFGCWPGFAEDFRQLLPFVSEDASRPWSMGLLLDAGLLTATNNVVLIQKWVGHGFPRINLPRFAVAEIARIGMDPIKASIDEGSITLHYADERWLKTQLFTADWPSERMETILNAESEPKQLVDGFREAVETLAPFAGEKSSAVYFTGDQISTSLTEGDGVHITVEGLPAGPIFSVGQLLLVAGIAETIDWDLYPNPCLFFGPGLRGAVVGMNH